MRATPIHAGKARLSLKSALIGLSAILLGANGVCMLAAPLTWFNTVTGVPDTGPFNPHLVRDVGLAYLTIALLAAAAIRWPRHAFALLSAITLYLGLHVLLHVWDIAAGHLPVDHLVSDVPGVLMPALVTGALAWWVRDEHA